MKKILFIVFCLFTFLGLVGCGTSAASETCNLNTYKKNAQPLMQEFAVLMTELDIRDDSSISETKNNLEILLTKVNRVECRDDFPLKHETLEYSVRHMIDALEYAEKGDFEEATNSTNKTLFNAETFNDWSVDLD